MTHYRYYCTTKAGLQVRGVLTWHSPFNRDAITDAIIHEVSVVAVSVHAPWDPFNLDLIVKAQTEPKPL